MVYARDALAYLEDYATANGRGALDTALAAVPRFNIQDLHHFALVDAGVNGAVLGPIMEEIRQNTSHRFYLAEHHLYGSSRIGIKHYWPGEHYFQYNYDTTGGKLPVDSVTLNSRAPWYSQELQEAVAHTSTQPYGAPFTQPWGVQHVLGMKGYEVTNHLGNVQAVVLDKKWGVDLTGDTTINRYRPSLMAAYDYYPFGMLMPGRYVNDTAQQCATITQTKLVPKWTYTYYIPKWECVGNCGFTKVKPAYTTFSFLYAGTEEAVLQVNTTTSAAGLQKFVAVTPGVEEEWLLPVASVEGNDYNIEVADSAGGIWRLIANATVSEAGDYHLRFNAASSTVRMRVLAANANDGSWIYFRPWKRWTLTYEPQTVLVKVCNEAGDRYRFGFNGMHKDNEIAGIGNSLDFTARVYQSRVGRFLSLDPLFKKFPSESNYSFAGNNPIFNIDKDGKIKTTYWVIQDQTTGKTVFTTQTAPGLMKVAYNPSDGMGGSLGKSYDWYDYAVVNTLTINKAGKATFNTETVRGQYKTNTAVGWEWYAALKTDDNKVKDKG